MRCVNSLGIKSRQKAPEEYALRSAGLDQGGRVDRYTPHGKVAHRTADAPDIIEYWLLCV